MPRITAAGVVLGTCKLGFSVAVLAVGKFQLGLSTVELQTLAFATLVFGSQAVLYVVRERRHLWSSRPSAWVLGASAADIAIVSTLALSGTLMAPLSWHVLAAVLIAAIGFALALDQIKRPVMAAFKVS
jgi:H+-transporting ATPase